jgi:multidrug efflux pump subunit AcrB
MLASYVLSRTLIPTLVMYFYRNSPYHEASEHFETGQEPPRWQKPFLAIQERFETGFKKFRQWYRGLLGTLIGHRWTFAIIFLALCGVSLFIVPFLGQDFFPKSDGGNIRLHVRARSGTRIEETAQLIDHVEESIRRAIPASEISGVLDNIGIPNSGISLSYSNNGVIGTGDADVLIQLAEGHKATDSYVRKLRLQLNAEFPGTTFYFLPADIVSQTLNLGLPAPFDIQIYGRDQNAIRQIAGRIAAEVRKVPGAVDVRIQQPGDQPRIFVNVDRARSAEIGLTEKDVANSVLLSLSGSGQVQPIYWLNSKAGIQYLVNVRAPEAAVASLTALNEVPISASSAGQGDGQILSNLATLKRGMGPVAISHYNVLPVIDVFGGVSGRDLGGVVRDINKIIADYEAPPPHWLRRAGAFVGLTWLFDKFHWLEQAKPKYELPRGAKIEMRGQAETMKSSFLGLGVGLVGAIVLIYLLLVINFQSWLDPFIIICALPGALAGVAWGLFVTQTTLSVPALMGAIMSLGVATANSVLVVSFARDNFHPGTEPSGAAMAAGATRLRAVIMTALAMILGMLPMSLGFGEGAEQNAPLARAVIGGLLFATVATLFFVPAVFSLLHKKKAAEPGPPSPDLDSPTSPNGVHGELIAAEATP